MRINGIHYTTIWETDNDVSSISIIDQRFLPHKFEIVQLKHFKDFIVAIKDMLIRGAPLIGVTAAYALYFAAKECSEGNFEVEFGEKVKELLQTRPTAVNLKNTVEQCTEEIKNLSLLAEKQKKLLETARELRTKDIEVCKQIGEFGANLLEEIYNRKGSRVNVLTHCNAGWLATMD